MITAEQIRTLGIALGDKAMGEAIGALINSGANAVGANVTNIGATSNLTGTTITPIGTTTDLVGVDGTGSNAAPLVETESRLDVAEAKIDQLATAFANVAPLAETESRLDTVEAKFDALATSLRNAGIIA